MKNIVKDLPIEERPRERLMKYGVTSLANYELLAIILRTGSKELSVLDLAKKILMEFQDLNHLFDATIVELTRLKGIGTAKAIEILAAIELGKRVNIPQKLDAPLKNPEEIYYYLKDDIQNLTQEHLICIYLNAKSEIITTRTISIGTTNYTIVNPKDVLKWAVKLSASAIILAHNHPSGNPLPSSGDIDVTKRLMEATKMFDIIFVDHVIIGKNKYFSLREHKLI